MIIKRVAKFIAIASLFATASLAAAQSGQPIQLLGEVKQEKTVTENGASKLVLVEPKVVVPGDSLVFTTSYRNAGSAAVKDFVVTNPVPSAVRVAENDAAQLQVSVDGGKLWGRLSSLTVADAKGVRRAAQAADVTHIRWTLAEIAAGGTGALRYHAVVR